MEMEEIEGVLEKIWDLHDKLSDEIHLISRSHFLQSVKPSPRSEKRKSQGYVFIKGFAVDSTIQEAKSLNAIRTALENLEDQLEFFHTIHTQQRTERDVAIARLEQSRMLLAMRLAEHHGKSYRVLEEALAFVGSIQNTTPPHHLYNPTGANSRAKQSNFLINAFGFAKKALGLDHVRGILGNAAIFAISMVVMLHLHQLPTTQPQRKTHRRDVSSAHPSLGHLDVMMARG